MTPRVDKRTQDVDIMKCAWIVPHVVVHLSDKERHSVNVLDEK